MKQKLCVLFLLFLAVVLVKSESSIEVDENGHEYDVKRFNIQGRQLGGPSKCVVSRRRRAATLAYDADEENQDSNGDVEESIGEVYAAPSGVAPTATLAPDTDENAEDITDEETGEEADLHDIALAAQYQSGVQSAAVAAAAADNGIVVVHAHEPPKVNGQTHAVFELLPVHPEDGPVYGSDDPYDSIDDEDILHLDEETSPTTTTAIWSTGDGNDNYDDYGLDQTTKKPKKKKPSPTRRPAKNKKKNGNKKNKKGKRPIKKRPSQKRPLRRPNNSRPRPNKRRLSQSNANRRVVMKNRNQNQNSFQQQHNNNNKRRINAKRRKNRPQEDVNQGVNSYTSTETVTDDSNDDEHRDINCIFINKDPTTTTTTTTTPRPFWNILGRDAGRVPAANSRYGNRKRVGLRFVA